LINQQKDNFRGTFFRKDVKTFAANLLDEIKEKKKKRVTNIYGPATRPQLLKTEPAPKKKHSKNEIKDTKLLGNKPNG